jgi:nucleotide-binding universal stress UspA family protein
MAGLTAACSLAQEAGAALTLVHVIEWPWHEPPAPSVEELPREQALALTEYRRYLERSAKDRLSSLIPEPTRDRLAITTRVAHGKAYAEILETARDTGADVIVTGVHGRNAIDMAVFGSTTNQLVRHATCPVLTVRHS